MDLLFLFFGYLLYRWGHRNGKVVGYNEAYQDEMMARMQEFLDEHDSE